ERACESAFPAPAPFGKSTDETVAAYRARLTPELRKQLIAWRREHRWFPHQLRHAAATRVRQHFGLEAARVILGHGAANVTEIYAEADASRGAEVMAKIG